jgi:MFS family permease
VRRLLADRNARLLLAGETLSMFGDRAMLIVLAVWMKDLTGSNAAAGMVFFVLSVPSLAAPLGGLLVDRVRRRPLMIAVDCFTAASVLLLLLVHDRGDAWLIYVVAGLYGTSFVVFGSAQSALLTVLLPRELLAEANGVFQTSREGLRLVAPLAGAGLYAAFGGGTVAIVDAATFAASIAALLALRVQEPRPAPAEHRFVTELTAGIVHVWRTTALRQIVLATGFALLVIGFSETLIFAVLSNGLHKPPSFFGVLSPAQGIGAVVGGVTAGRVLNRVGDWRLVGLGVVAFGIGDVPFVTHSIALVAAGLVVAGFGISWAIVGFVTAVQLRTPAHLQGRAYSATETVLTLPQTISVALGAGLSTLIDYRILVVTMTVVTVAAGLYLLLQRLSPPPATAAEAAADVESIGVGLAIPQSDARSSRVDDAAR